MHSSVLKPFAVEAVVRHYYEIAPYPPRNLSAHLKLMAHYTAPPPSGGAALAAAWSSLIRRQRDSFLSAMDSSSAAIRTDGGLALILQGRVLPLD